MAGGWARDGAIQEQIDASVNDAIELARSRMTQGESLKECEECGEPIPEARRKALAGVRKCIRCQEEADTASQSASMLNRRGSKDSQLR